MAWYYYIAAIIISIALWNLMIAVLGLFPQFLSTAVGTLTNTNTKRNVESRHGYRIPIVTTYGYTYNVNGKAYRYSSQGLHSKRRLLPKVSMVFVKWFPRRAYPNKFKGINEWMIGLSMLFMGLVFIWAITYS